MRASRKDVVATVVPPVGAAFEHVVVVVFQLSSASSSRSGYGPTYPDEIGRAHV